MLLNGKNSVYLGQYYQHYRFKKREIELVSCKLLNFRLREHVEDPDKLPILIFPEGTCINNTSVMQFKKGSFEVIILLKYMHRFVKYPLFHEYTEIIYIFKQLFI